MNVQPYYEQEGISIFHGDCVEVVGSLPLITLLLTDPPFFMPATHYASRSDKWSRSWGDTSVLSGWWRGVLDSIMPRLSHDASLITFCDGDSYPVFYPELYRRFSALLPLVWDKGRIGMGAPWRRSHELLIHARFTESKWSGGGGLSDVLRVTPVGHTERLHPVDKPVDLLRQLIEPTTEKGDLVFDPFMGGGSTLLAARDLSRRAVGVEIEEKYCEIAAKRLSQRGLFS